MQTRRERYVPNPASSLGVSVYPRSLSAAPAYFAIVKVNGAIRKNLVVLVAFACEQNDVSGARFFDGQADGLGAVRFDHVFAAGLLHADDDVADDFQRVFLAGIVAR